MTIASDERRTHSRRLVCVAAHIEGTEQEHLALLRDISVSGAMFLTRTCPEPDEEIDVVLVFDEGEDPSELAVHARTVRVQEVEEDRRDVWRYRIAVAFTGDLSEHKPLFERLAAELAAAGLTF